MKKRIIFSDLKGQSDLTQAAFRRLTPLERLMQLRRDIERLYAEELKIQRKGKMRIIIDEYIP